MQAGQGRGRLQVEPGRVLGPGRRGGCAEAATGPRRLALRPEERRAGAEGCAGGSAGTSPPGIPASGSVSLNVTFSVSAPTGILKNKVTYPPPLTEKSLKSRLREKLAECEQSPAPSRSSSLGSSDGARAPDGAITVKSPRREPGREHLNGVAMNVRAGSAQAAGSDSE